MIPSSYVKQEHFSVNIKIKNTNHKKSKNPINNILLYKENFSSIKNDFMIHRLSKGYLQLNFLHRITAWRAQ